MTGRQYKAMLQWLRQRPGWAKAVQVLTRGLPVLFAISYTGICVGLFLLKDMRLFRFMGVPAGTLATVLVLRRVLKRPRPYEVYGFQPLISREKGGDSCPSNHTASAFSIALAVWYLWRPGGIVALALAAAVGASRVVTGVHWPEDVAAGAGIAFLYGIMGFWIF